jgi:muramoyltetrapeptide carboxypeptidase
MSVQVRWHFRSCSPKLRLRGVFGGLAGLVIGYSLGSDEPGTGNDRDIADIVTEMPVPAVVN